MTETELIMALCAEAGDEVSDADAIENGFRGNHSADDIRDAAAGDVAALLRLREACGLPMVV